MCPTTKFHLRLILITSCPKILDIMQQLLMKRHMAPKLQRNEHKETWNRDILWHFITIEHKMFVYLCHLRTNRFQADQPSKSADTETPLNPLWCWDFFASMGMCVTTPWWFWKSDSMSFKLLSTVSFTAVIHMWTLAIMSAGERGTQRT